MNMFTRNDKVFDSGAGDKPSAREKVESPVPAPTDIRRTQASAQSFSDMAAPQGRMPSVISKALKITGQVESTDDIQLDGEVDGDVRGVTVKVGSNAKVKGTVYGDEVELAGTIDGKIEAKKVVLTSTAHMSGDIIHQDIKIESGAFVDGHCRPEFGKAASKTVHQAPKPVAAAPVAVAREKTAPEKSHDVGPRI
ncbi:MAG: polymer-forming cytoskeletal protein [Alphaproteobacteria bacterium]|nr:polymer-forming cytoskeletal protein [Alphaproteobacteria bacterium]